MSRVTCSNCCFWLPVIVLLWRLTGCIPSQYPLASSPCPNLFTYRYDTNRSQYYGFVDFETQPLKNSAEVEISFSIAAQLPSSYVGSIETIGDNRQLIEQIGKGLGVTYRVNLPLQDPLPRLTKLSLNGRVLCSGSSEKGGFVTEVNLRHFLRSDASPTWQKVEYKNDHHNSPTRPQLPKEALDQFKLIDHREQNHTVERTEQEISPTRNSTSYKYVTQIVSFKEYVSAPMVNKTSHYFVNTTTREQV